MPSALLLTVSADVFIVKYDFILLPILGFNWKIPIKIIAIPKHILSLNINVDLSLFLSLFLLEYPLFILLCLAE